MPKVIIEFNLPEEESDFHLAQHAGLLHSVIWNFGEWLRRKHKHEPAKSDAHAEEYDEILNKWIEECAELNLSLLNQ